MLKMQNIKWKITLILSSIWLVSCTPKNGDIIGQLVPLALQGDVSTPYVEPIGKVLDVTSTTGSSVSLYQAESGVAVCKTGVKEPSNDFGQTGPEAFLVLCSETEVDRYRNLEIRFSEPMNKTTVEANFTILKEGASLPGPSPGGVFIWKSPQRLFFDPYRELSSVSSYSISITSGAQTVDGKSLKDYNVSFQSAHDYLMTSTITQGTNTILLNQEKDITFQKTSGDLVLNTSWQNSAGIDTTVSKIVFNKIGNVLNGIPNSSAKEICSGNCTGNPISINLSTDPLFSNSPLSLTDGGNTYYYEITTKTGAKYQRFLSFNWGNVTNPNNMINNVASGVLDQTQMLKMLERLIELFTEAKFKVTNKTFNNFASQPTATGKNTTKCINYGNFSFITNYGDNTTGGYCGGDGDNPGAFQATTWAGCFGNAELDMDVYVSQISIPPTVGGLSTVEADLGVNGNGEIGIDLKGRKAYLTLEVVAKNRNSLLCLVGAGNKFHFRTRVELNPPSNYSIRLARARNTLSVDGSGNLGLIVKTPHSASDDINGNFHIQPWVDNLVVEGMDLIDSTNWVTNILSPITEIIADQLVPQVKPAITQVVLKSIVQNVAPNVLNAIVGTLKDPGIDITLPSYLPAPLANYPLSVKVQLSNDAQVRSQSGNKGIVASVHAGLFAKTPLAAGSQRQHANMSICGSGCMIYTKDPTVPLIPIANHAPFNQSATTPGFLLSMHSDSVTQAAYHLWKNRAIDLNIDSTFISSVNSYAGDDPLLKLTDSILKVSAITAIIAPGRQVLYGLDTNNNLLQPICANDDVRFKLDPLMPPVARMIDNTGFDPANSNQPNMQISFNDLQITIQGRRTDSSTACTTKRGAPDNAYYTLATIRVSMKSNAAFRIVAFDNPNTVPNEFQNALNLKVFTEGLVYSLDVLEGPTYNPYGLDPAGIKSVFDPLVTSLVVPLVNSILNRVPLPPDVPFSALNRPTSTAACLVSAKRDHALEINSLPVPSVDAASNPYLFANVQLKGNALVDPKFLLEAACR
jgi:hypothetical protein